MAPFYEHLCNVFKWPVDQALLDRMKKLNEEKIQALEAKLTDAESNLGETEVFDALLARADYYTQIGDKVRFFVCSFRY